MRCPHSVRTFANATMPAPSPIAILGAPTRHPFFAGAGDVGGTILACAMNIDPEAAAKAYRAGIAVFDEYIGVPAAENAALDHVVAGHGAVWPHAAAAGRHGGCHRGITCGLALETQRRIVTPLMRLHDRDYSKVFLVAALEAEPVSSARLPGAHRQVARVENGLACRADLLPWQGEPPVGVDVLLRLVS